MSPRKLAATILLIAIPGLGSQPAAQDVNVRELQRGLEQTRIDNVGIRSGAILLDIGRHVFPDYEADPDAGPSYPRPGLLAVIQTPPGLAPVTDGISVDDDGATEFIPEIKVFNLPAEVRVAFPRSTSSAILDHRNDLSKVKFVDINRSLEPTVTDRPLVELDPDGQMLDVYFDSVAAVGDRVYHRITRTLGVHIDSPVLLHAAKFLAANPDWKDRMVLHGGNPPFAVLTHPKKELAVFLDVHGAVTERPRGEDWVGFIGGKGWGQVVYGNDRVQMEATQLRDRYQIYSAKAGPRGEPPAVFIDSKEGFWLDAAPECLVLRKTDFAPDEHDTPLNESHDLVEFVFLTPGGVRTISLNTKELLALPRKPLIESW